jgi:hypothetical protein
MLVEDLDEVFQNCCDSGENLVFAVMIAARPQPLLMLRAMGASGLGIIGKTQQYLRKIPNIRAKLGATANVKQGKIAIVFISSIPAGTLSVFRKRWYSKVYKLAEIIHGRGNWQPKDLVALIDDRTVQFQVTFNLESLEFTDLKYFEKFEILLDSESRLRTAMSKAAALNLKM